MSGDGHFPSQEMPVAFPETIRLIHWYYRDSDVAWNSKVQWYGTPQPRDRDINIVSVDGMVLVFITATKALLPQGFRSQDWLLVITKDAIRVL